MLSSTGDYVSGMLPRSEYQWLMAQHLSLGVAVAELRELRAQGSRTGYVLSADAQQALTRLTEAANRAQNATRTESDQLEILIARAPCELLFCRTACDSVHFVKICSLRSAWH